MSYLNLACLLMTLVCLVTIVLFSTSSGGNNQQQPNSLLSGSGSGGSSSSSNRLAIARKLQSPTGAGVDSEAADQEAESMPEPSGQSLNAAHSKDDSIFDDFATGNTNSAASTDYPDADDLWMSQRPKTKLRRKSGPEREIEDFPTAAAAGEQTQQNGGPTNESTKEEQQQQPVGSLLEPILSQIFKDLELDSVFKAALNGTGKQSAGRPIVRRSKNGATIIISSSFNESSLANQNETSGSASPLLPSLLQKLLPPMLFKQQPGSKSLFGDNLASGTATITISGRAIEPPFGSGSSPFSVSAGDVPPMGLFPFLAPSASAPRPIVRTFFPEPMAFRINSLASSPSQFAALPFPSPLGMMLRSMAAEAEELSTNKLERTTEQKNTNSSTKPTATNPMNETLSTQASQQQQQTIASGATSKLAGGEGSNNNKTTQANSTATAAVDPEVETFDVSQLPIRQQLPTTNHRSRFSLFSGHPAQQSVMIFGSSNPESIFGGSPFAGGLPGLPLPMPPHMMMMASGGSSSSDGSDGGPLVTSGSPSTWSSSPMPMPINPILRALFSNLAGPGSADSDEKNRTGIDRSDQSSQGATIRVIRPVFGPLEMLDSLSADDASDRQAMAASHMRAKHHRAAADMLPLDELDSSNNEAPQSLADLISDQQSGEHSATGVIRQTFRGPGMTVERIIEVPSAQQVPRGVRSQSISRLIEDMTDISGNEEAAVVKSSSSRRSNIIGRRDDPMEAAGPIMMPNRMSFIGKLLSDLSRHSSSPRVLMSRSDIEDQMVDDSGEVRSEQAPTWGPKIRVASARLRIRPSSPFGSEALFLPHRPQLSAHISGEAQQQQQQQHQQQQQVDNLFEPENGEQDSGKPMSLEDTLNSMEDRLDKVLSQYGPTPATHRAIITPVEKPRPMDQQQQIPDNVYTSPTSPFFGFPTSSSSSSSSSAATDSTQDSTNQEEKKSSISNREPRSFTYHSNNELATNLKAAQRREQEQRESESAEMRAESIGRASKFGPFFAPPAGAMGRRLDDGPFGEPFPSSSMDEKHQQPESAATSVAPTFLEGRAMMPVVTGSHNKRPAAAAAANNEPAQFRTIVV